MSAVDVSQVPAGLFIMGAIFILLTFSLLSLGILRMFQLRFKAGWLSFAGAVASGALFGILLDRWFL
ncbi:MAG TPA: hypothetical protein VMS09_02515 [Paenibacillus sp.]|uniref:hypothetical protein n=1 Tax=Paenibacillus sp. TaxID=58172 RepID=UPI0028D75C91|nr:hypothetical protein [Paenibacillus sp.]HUC90883.1 hypothetical protein [Paenibacillus sp.]